MAYVVNKKIILGVMIVLLIMSVSFSVAISRENYQNFLKQEMEKYFNGEPTLLTLDELREAIDFYFSSTGAEINLSESNLSQNSINILEGTNFGEATSNEFECTVTAKGKEFWSEGETETVEGLQVACCNTLISRLFGATSCVDRAKFTNCSDEFKDKIYFIKARALCREAFGKDYSTIHGMLFNPYAPGLRRCEYNKTQAIQKEIERTASEDISFNLSKGQTKSIPITISLTPSHTNGDIRNVEYSVECLSSKIITNIAGGKLYVERNND